MKQVLMTLFLLVGINAYCAGAKIRDCNHVNAQGVCIDYPSASIDEVALDLVNRGYCGKNSSCNSGSVFDCATDNLNMEIKDLESTAIPHRSFLITKLLTDNRCIQFSNLSALEDDIQEILNKKLGAGQ